MMIEAKHVVPCYLEQLVCLSFSSSTQNRCICGVVFTIEKDEALDSESTDDLKNLFH